MGKTIVPTSKDPVELKTPQVCKILGVSPFKVRSLVAEKVLTPRKEGRTFLFVRSQVLEVARTFDPQRQRRYNFTEGEMAAKVFERFQRGDNLVTIVCELREHPDKIRKLYRDYRDSDLERSYRAREQGTAESAADKLQRRLERREEKERERVEAEPQITLDEAIARGKRAATGR